MSLGVLISLQFIYLLINFFKSFRRVGVGGHAFPLSQIVKNLPVMQKTLGWKNPLKKGMATHSSILA